MFTDNIGVDLGLTYFSGRSQSINVDRTSPQLTWTSGFSAQMLQFVPSVVIKGGFEKLDPYIRFGMVIGLANITYDLNTYEGGFDFQESWKYNGSLALGVSAGLGLSYKMNDRMSIFAEMTFIGMSYAPTQGELASRTINGVDGMEGLTTNERERRFVDSYTPRNILEPSTEDPNSPQEFPRTNFPMSSIGLNVGVIFNF